MMKHSIYPLFILPLLFIELSAQTLPSDLIWNDDETGYYEIKENNIVLTHFKSADQQLILSSGEIGNINIESFSFSKNKNKVLLFTNSKKVWRYNTRGDYWIYDFEKKEIKKLGDGFDESSLMFAKFSPDDAHVAYVHKENTNTSVRNRSTKANIYIENLEKNTIRKLTSSEGTEKLINGTFDWVYEEEFSCRDGFLFNEDGTKIAFWQVNANKVKDFHMINNTDSIYSYTIPVEYPKVGEELTAVKVGVIDLNKEKTTWMSIPGAEDKFFIPRMTWIPGKDKLMIQQLNRDQNHSKIFISNAVNGNSKLLLEDIDSAWVDVRTAWPNQPQAGWKFINNGKEFLYVSEKDGWSHIHKYNIKSHVDKVVTAGNYDVIKPLSYDEKNDKLYFLASPDAPTERYLYYVSILQNDKLNRATPEILEGYHNYEISPKSKYAFHTFSNYYTRPFRSIVSLPNHSFIGETKKLSEITSTLQKESHPLEFFRITTVEQISMDGWIVKPTDFDPTKKYPVLFYFYSEPARQTALNRFGAGYNPLYNGNLQDDGYVYVTFDGRGTPSPKGREWRKSIYKKIGQINVRDMAMGAKAVFEKFSFIDQDRVAVHGWSGGGSATLNCLFQYPEIFHTGIAIAAVTNQLTYDNIYQERYMGDPSEGVQNYIAGSPLTHVENFKGNLLYIHGTGDDNVHYQNAELLANEMIKHKKVFYMMPYPNRSHSLREDNAIPHLRLMFTDFLRKNCPPGGR